MSKRNNFELIPAAIIMAFFIINPVLGINIVASTGGASLSQNLNLDKGTHFSGNALLIDGSIFQDSQAGGSGHNKIHQRISGAEYSIETIMPA